MNPIIDCEPDDVVEAECPLCGGEGITDYYVSGINYYSGSLNEHWRTCAQCHGSGTQWAASVPATEEEVMAPVQHDYEAEDDKGWRCTRCGHQT